MKKVHSTTAERAAKRTGKMAVHFSSQTDVWATPQWLFDALNAEFRFETDVCALPENAKCRSYFTPAQNGLRQVWTGVCYCNPPYGRQIGQWIRKAFEASQSGATVVCLIPARTDASWWHNYVMRAAEVRFLRGRLKFGNASTGAPFPSAVVVFRPKRPRIRSADARPAASRGESPTLFEQN